MADVEKEAEKFCEELISKMDNLSLDKGMMLGEYAEFLSLVKAEISERLQCVKIEAGEE